MPWCRQCDRLVDDDELTAHRAGSDAGEDGIGDRCPTCGAELEVDDRQGARDAPLKAPWHFKVLVVGTVVYLGYRLYQGIGWLIHHA
ncbi:MAG: hypothetical protein ACLPUG_06280 [Acidimicrobiales bacterium]